jgi:hypothetical protein
MSNAWRIVNPALEPPQVAFESGDEQAALREYAARDGLAQGLRLVKSEDDGKTWVAVEARAPDPAPTRARGPADAGGGLERGELGGSSGHADDEKPKHDKREKASK